MFQDAIDHCGLVDESVPSQQGLKHPGPDGVFMAGQVDESVPSQQGLKPKSFDNEIAKAFVSMQGILVSEHLFANNDELTPNCPWCQSIF